MEDEERDLTCRPIMDGVGRIRRVLCTLVARVSRGIDGTSTQRKVDVKSIASRYKTALSWKTMGGRHLMESTEKTTGAPICGYFGWVWHAEKGSLRPTHAESILPLSEDVRSGVLRPRGIRSDDLFRASGMRRSACDSHREARTTEGGRNNLYDGCDGLLWARRALP